MIGHIEESHVLARFVQLPSHLLPVLEILQQELGR